MDNQIAFYVDDYWGPLEVTYNYETDDYTITQGDQVIFITGDSLHAMRKHVADALSEATP